MNSTVIVISTFGYASGADRERRSDVTIRPLLDYENGRAYIALSLGLGYGEVIFNAEELERAVWAARILAERDAK